MKKISKKLKKHQEMVKTVVILDNTSITVNPPFSQGISYLCSGGSKGDGQKQISQRKARKKRGSIRSRHSRKMAQEIRELYYRYKKNIGVDKNGMILPVHSIVVNEYYSKGAKVVSV
ncbi:MAG: hypothetical protein ACMUEL_09735 [Flavobacteriales bacterium Tduv]